MLLSYRGRENAEVGNTNLLLPGCDSTQARLITPRRNSEGLQNFTREAEGKAVGKSSNGEKMVFLPSRDDGWRGAEHEVTSGQCNGLAPPALLVGAGVGERIPHSGGLRAKPESLFACALMT